MTVQLHPNAVLYFMFRHVLKLAVLGFFVFVFIAGGTMHGTVNGHASTYEAPRMLFGGLYILLVIAVIGYNWLLVKSYSVELTKDGIALHYGVVNLSREVLLYTKVQDIVITRNLLERVLGISSITIQNAMGKAEYIPCLGVDAAETLRTSILANAKG